MRRVQNCTNRWKQLFALLLCLVMMMSAGWTGAFAETEVSPEIPEPPESDLLADVETSDYWDEMFADLNLSGNWAEDLLAVAESQIGYKQSRRNFEAVYNEEKNSYDLYGWSRYGAWYKEPYAEWSTLFVCFCLSYAGIPSEVIPYDSEAASWADKLSELGLFQAAEDYTPKPGDLMFTDWDADGKIDHVGIVREVNEEYDEIVTIEGDSNSGVDLYGYDALDSIIAGFATLPEKPDGLAAVEQYIRGDNGRGDVPSPDQTSETTAGDEEAVLTDAAFAENADASDIPDPPESDLLADVETTEDWDEMFAGMELSGNWAEDLVNVAKSQLGYTESIRNFEAIYADDRNAYDLYGWTRYGAWYGEPYGEWNAMFVSFCLFYAGVSSDAVPYDSDPARWADTLRTRELFRELEEDYTPEPGDLIFFDRDGDGRADRVGVVSEVNPETGALNTVEGGRSGRVDAYGYAANPKVGKATHGINRTHAAPGVDRKPLHLADGSYRLGVCLACGLVLAEGAGEVHHVDPASSPCEKVTRHRGGVVRIDVHAGAVPVRKAHHLASHQVDRGKEDHRTPPALTMSTKLESTTRPVAEDFSGWN